MPSLRLNRTKLSDQISAILLEQIKTKELKPGARLPSEKEFAQQFAVSVPVIRQAIEILIKKNLIHRRQGSGTFIRPDALDWLAGRPRPQGTLALVMDYIEGSDYFGQLYNCIGRAAQAAKWSLQLIHPADLPPRELRDQLLDSDLQGILWAWWPGPHFAPTVLQINKKIPIVMVNTSADVDVMSITTDEIAGAKLATQHLIDQGHRRIAYIGGSQKLQHYNVLRYQGFKSTMKAAGLAPDPKLQLELNEFHPSTQERKRFAQILDQATAIFFSTGDLFTSFQPAIQKKSPRIPQDLAIIVFDDFPQLQRHDPPISAIHQHLPKIAEEAINLLTETSQGLKVKNPHRLLPPQLIIRESTKSS